ncbi:VanZ family protein [Nocardioides mangrovicus]|uniref:VanZ family protein n=1 Tax=Nocardioides mangrovicus TaxID=2478913 RepID=A0A3L8P8B5_9ACTN|nr:VanZ family protein [Nocardioides mangrovicus]RLV50698.1 VanZ family protein [Nocardioides mangrovicus]
MIARPVFVAVCGASLFVLFLPGSDVPTNVPVSDKVVHAGLFFLLALTGRWAGLSTATLAVELVLYAAASEVLQSVLPIHRDGDVRDALADVAGLAMGLVVARLVRRRALG